MESGAYGMGEIERWAVVVGIRDESSEMIFIPASTCLSAEL